MNLQWERDSGIIFIALLVLWIQPVSAQTAIMEETPPQSTAAGFDSDPFDSCMLTSPFSLAFCFFLSLIHGVACDQMWRMKSVTKN